MLDFLLGTLFGAIVVAALVWAERRFGSSARVPGWAVGLKQSVDILGYEQRLMMKTLDEVLDVVNDETTLIGGVGAMIGGLRSQVASAMANQALPPGLQAKVDAIFTSAQKNKEALATALGTNIGGDPALATTSQDQPNPSQGSAQAGDPQGQAAHGTAAVGGDPIPTKAAAGDPAPSNDPAAKPLAGTGQNAAADQGGGTTAGS